MRLVEDAALQKTQPELDLVKYENAQPHNGSCGGPNEPVCYKPLKAEKKGDIGCEAGDFFSLRNGGECWSCPSGYEPTLDAMNPFTLDTSQRACVKTTSAGHVKAIKGDPTPWPWECTGKYFWDVGNARCYRCPDDNPHRTLHSVTGSKACSSPSRTSHHSASFVKKVGWCDAGQFPVLGENSGCYTCPRYYSRDPFQPIDGEGACARSPWQMCDPGNMIVGSQCQTAGYCGREGQRPCYVYERIPSCDAGLVEDFGNGTCRKQEANQACKDFVTLLLEAKATAEDAKVPSVKFIDNIVAALNKEKEKLRKELSKIADTSSLEAEMAKRTAPIEKQIQPLIEVRNTLKDLEAEIFTADFLCGATGQEGADMFARAGITKELLAELQGGGSTGMWLDDGGFGLLSAAYADDGPLVESLVLSTGFGVTISA